jgi:glycosyltransferase involved in cell wall biosynthesis
MSVDLASLKVAIVHYWFFDAWRGGEKVVSSLCQLFPQADIFTHVLDAKVFADLVAKHRVTTSFIQQLPFARKATKYYVPLMPLALEQFDLNEYDLVISSESGPAKGVIVREDCVHICYCHSPMRYIWNKYAEEIRGSPTILSWPIRLAAHYLRLVDYASAARVDQFIANSNAVARRIRKYYRRPSRVIFPPVEVSAFSMSEQIEEYYLYCGQLTAYKRPDLAVDCFNDLGLPLWVIGDGEMRVSLERRARANIRFLGRVSNEQLRQHLARCAALVFPGEEDFGIVPVEALASGRPVIAYGRGGVLDSVVDGVTGLFFYEPTVGALAQAVQRFRNIRHEFDPRLITQSASVFDTRNFIEQMTDVVQHAFAVRSCPPPRKNGVSRRLSSR